MLFLPGCGAFCAGGFGVFMFGRAFQTMRICPHRISVWFFTERTHASAYVVRL